MWATSLAIADACYVLLVLIGGIVVMSHETVQTSTSAKEIAPRLVLGLAAANLSMILITRAVSLANGLSAALAGQGVDPQAAGQALASTIRNSVATGGVFLILLALVAVILALVLAVIYVLRLMAVVLLAAAAPLALALLRAAADRVGGPLVVAGADRRPGHPGRPGPGADRRRQGVLHPRLAHTSTGQYLVHVLITMCLLYILMRIPFWIARPVLSPFGGSPLRRAARFAFTAAVLSRVAPVLRGTAAARRRRRRRRGR